MSIPRIYSYSTAPSVSAQANAMAVSTAKGTVFYSYETPIAFRDRKGNEYVSQNEWNTTTGKHINMIDRDKSIRIPNAELKAIIETELSE